jgi:hypothetical protein
MKLPGKIAINTIQQNLPNLTTAQLDLFTQSISLSPNDIVSVDINQIINTITDKTFSMRLKRWIEPYTIGGVDYSLFYTEVDHNFKVGDRAFIEGGVYDSDNFTLIKKYRKGSDGYKVLYVDRCKIVLDIKYTGDLPTNEEEIDNFVKIYVASTQEEFDYYCQTLSLRDDTGIIQNKFDLGFNNFLYLNGTFSITPGSYNLTSFASDFSITSTFSTLGDSFLVRGATGTGTYFVDITSDVFSNTFTPYLNPGWTQSLSGFFNNGKLRMMNGNFIKNGVSFKNEYIYYFDTITNTWKIDKSYLPTILTEQHFRRGIFKSGKYNQGLYGQHEERIKYYGDAIKWNLGTTLNVDWHTGVLDSTIFNENSFFTIFDRFNLPQIRANASNNGGAGYNYVFNTNFHGGDVVNIDVVNGNIFNMAVVYGTNSATASALEDYLTGQPTNFSINISGGVYYNSDIIFASMSNSTLISSYVFNSILNKCKSVNSEIESSVFLNSTWLSDKIVKIQNYEESNIVWYDENSLPVNYKMYKFYLTDTNWLRLREFQNFYFQDLGINIPSTELLNFFDDKFSVGQYYQTYDMTGGTPSKPERRVLIQLSTTRENRNSPGTIVATSPQSDGNNVQPNYVALPSLDIFIEGGDDFDYATGSVYPRPFLNDTIDITRAYILDSDFVSGLFKDSRWVSGNYFNYNNDYAFSSSGGYTASVDSPNRKLTLTVGPRKRYDILGTSSLVSNIAFVNGLWYDSTLNGGSNLIPIPDTYRVTDLIDVPGSRFLELQDIMTQSVMSSFGSFVGQKYLITKNAKNKWNYVHPTKFENSTISSGIFRRAYFKNCNFSNFEFELTDRDLTNVSNKRKLLLSDIIFDGDGNNINSGLVQYSHLVSGNDDWNNGIFHRGVWNTSTFTYSLSPTSSVVYTSGKNTFRGGIFRNSTWIDGIFENGLFYRNITNIPTSPNIFTDTDSYYYYDNVSDNKLRWSWQKGTFRNGDFEKSNFESGQFTNGNFYDSNFLTGEATGGNFGKSNIPYQNSRVWTGTFSNVNVINAEFRTESPKGLIEKSSIFWNSGIFNSGVFGVTMSSTYNPIGYTFSATWLNGTFNNGEFTDVAEWKDGEFNNGKFTSYYWYELSNPRTPFELMSFTGASFSWQNGKFNGGEFGTGTSSRNSTWFKGEFNGGVFQGRYWRDGIFTKGKFLGSSTQSTDFENYNAFINSFNTQYYGFWQDGFVSKNKDRFIKDERLFTQIERVSNRKKKSRESLFNNVLWYSGTFSNFDAEMNNCVWLDGTFQDGYFANSVFNPYINIVSDIVLPLNFTATPFIFTTYPPFTSKLQPGQVYSVIVEISENSGTNQLTSPITTPLGLTGIFTGTFSSTSLDLVISRLNFTNFTIQNLIIYPGKQSGFRIGDSCIWENGEAYSSDFYFSKWKQGIFDSYATSSQGNAYGIIWQDGINKYMNAYNVLWESGIWKNGNWNGSPFSQIATYSVDPIVYPGFSSDIINNISLYGSQSLSNTLETKFTNWSQLHMNNVFGTNSVEYDFNLNNDLYEMNHIPFVGATISLTSSVSYKNNTSIVFNKNFEFNDLSYWQLSVYGSQSVFIQKGLNPGNSNFVYVDLTTTSSGGATLSQDGILTTGQSYNLIIDAIFNVGTVSVTFGDSTTQSPLIIPFGQTGSFQYNFVAQDSNFVMGFSNNSLLNGVCALAFNSIKVCSTLETRFGNGQFLSGIWENGVWNEGWREDLTYIVCDNLLNFTGGLKGKSYKTDVWTWEFTLNVPNISVYSPGLIFDFKSGDKVSVGNIVSIDINGNRRLIRDFLIIKDIDYINTSITLEVNINFPIRSIEKDSDEHLIYVSKDIWLNGIFLNGRFKDGVWNNGLFQGYPYITLMENSQWVDGIFKGGRFVSRNGSYLNDIQLNIEYSTGLIQKFDFFDQNVSGSPLQFKYNSWIDVNYYTNEGVNINRINDVYKLTSLGVITSFVENNFYGYPTKDVLESNSTLRNAFDLNSRTYRLGYKWKEYTNYLDEVGEFVDINEYGYINTNPPLVGVGFGIDNFLFDGWTFSWLGPSQGFATAINGISSNIGNLESEWLYLSGGRLSPQSVPFDDNDNFTVDTFNNSNINIDKLRYSFIELEADNLGFTQSASGAVNPWILYNNFPGSYSIAAVTTLFNGNNISMPVNQVATNSVVTQREYFFNKKKLDMVILSGPTYSLRFKKIRFVETDMIPFTQIADDCIQFRTITTWDTTPVVSTPGTQSHIVPPDPEYPYPGQWELAQPESMGGNLQVVPEWGQPTWDNFYLVFGGEGCISYINEDIQVPNQSKAPDLDSDIILKTLSANNVTLAENPIFKLTGGNA